MLCQVISPTPPLASLIPGPNHAFSISVSLYRSFQMNLATWFMSSGRIAVCGTGKFWGKKLLVLLSMGVAMYTMKWLDCWKSFIWCWRLNHWACWISTPSLLYPSFLVSLCFETRSVKLSRMILHLLCSPVRSWIWNAFASAQSNHDSRPAPQGLRCLLHLKNFPFFVTLNPTVLRIYFTALYIHPALSICILLMLVVKQN